MTHLDEKVSDLQTSQERLNNKLKDLDQKVEPIIPTIERLEQTMITMVNGGK